MQDKKIKLKYEHSYRVMELMSTLAERLRLTEEEKCIAELIGDGIIVKKGSEKLWKETIKIYENRLNENIYKENELCYK